MATNPPDLEDAERSLYDPEETPDEDLWFLPGPGVPAEAGAPPGQMGTGTGGWAANILDVSEWTRVAVGAGRALADAASAFARLDERCRNLPGAAERLAILCASAALQAQGDWLPSEKLALYLALREGAGEDAQLLSQADWSVRRLTGGLDPRDDLNGYLGRHPTDHDGLMDLDLFGEPARGEEFGQLARDWLVAQEELEDRGAHPLTRAGVGFHLWRTMAISEPGSVVEAAVIASVLGAKDGRYLQFVPAALGGRQNLLARGSASERLQGWLNASTDGCARALLELDRVETWQGRAMEAISDLSGRTPPLIVEEMLRVPLVSADMLSVATGASKAAIRRNMATFEDRGLVYEVTGQGRYRFWRMAV